MRWGAYGYGIMRYGIGLQASTMAFLSPTKGQLLHAISCRSETPSVFSTEPLPPNRYLNLALLGSFTVQVLALVIPGLRRLLGIAPIDLLDSLVIGSSALLPLLVNEASNARGRSLSATPDKRWLTGRVGSVAPVTRGKRVCAKTSCSRQSR